MGGTSWDLGLAFRGYEGEAALAREVVVRVLPLLLLLLPPPPLPPPLLLPHFLAVDSPVVRRLLIWTERQMEAFCRKPPGAVDELQLTILVKMQKRNNTI